jgi:exopolysaccharide biosynthesis polyprenyl glycosylphosphotransferase
VLVGPAADCLSMWWGKPFTPRNGFRVIGFIDTDPIAAANALGHADDLEELVRRHQIDTIIMCGHSSETTFAKVVKAALPAECRVLSVARTFQHAGMQPVVTWRHDTPFIEWRALTVRGQQLMLKRTLDVVLSVLLMIVLAPLLLAVAVAVRVNSPGPIVFGQRRLGRHGRMFRCLKFRSMYVDAEQRLRADRRLYGQYVRNNFKLPEETDSRVTPVGRFLRRTSLDELPQLWNVLRGEMSLVGPRPIVPEELAHYNESSPLLLSLRPGLTGSWQVNGRSSVPYPERAWMELEYVQNWTIGTDVELLIRTVPAVLGQRGAH